MTRSHERTRGRAIRMNLSLTAPNVPDPRGRPADAFTRRTSTSENPNKPELQHLPNELRHAVSRKNRIAVKIQTNPRLAGFVCLFGVRGVERTRGDRFLLVGVLLAGVQGYRTAAAFTCSRTSSLTCADSTWPLHRGTSTRPTRLPSHFTNSPRTGTYASSTSLPAVQAE